MWEKTINTREKRKASSSDTLTMEMIALVDFAADKITEMYNDIYNIHFIPKDIERSAFITFPNNVRSN